LKQLTLADIESRLVNKMPLANGLHKTLVQFVINTYTNVSLVGRVHYWDQRFSVSNILFHGYKPHI